MVAGMRFQKFVQQFVEVSNTLRLTVSTPLVHNFCPLGVVHNRHQHVDICGGLTAFLPHHSSVAVDSGILQPTATRHL